MIFFVASTDPSPKKEREIKPQCEVDATSLIITHLQAVQLSLQIGCNVSGVVVDSGVVHPMEVVNVSHEVSVFLLKVFLSLVALL